MIMARKFGADLLTSIETLLKDNLQNMLDVIKVEREDSGIEDIRKINIGYMERQYPECLISLGNSDVDVETLSMDIMQTQEEYPAEVVIVLKDITAKSYLRQEYYIEALSRVLHGYTEDGIQWIVVTSAIRENMYTEQKEILRVVGVSLLIRIL